MATQTGTISRGRNIRQRLQRVGGFLAAMVIPNIAAFIAWGLITALFIPTGWLPNANIANLVGPFITYLLPLLLGYSGGKLVYGHRGGVVGAIAVAGVVVGSDVPMFLGAMIMGPLAGWLIKKIDGLLDERIPTGFEMLINNFTAGILGGGLAIIGYLIIGPVMDTVSNILGNGAMWVTNNHLLPFIAIFIEPGKVLFLNNAINHGILTPLGVEQAKTLGKSIFFLLETDPGPGLGILVAYWLFGKGNAKQSAPSAIVIQFLGGIHEIYFPYVLMRPMLIFAVILGGFFADSSFLLLHAGLVAPASPGSIFAEIMMSPKNGMWQNMIGIAVGAIVSFGTASLILRRTKNVEVADDDFNVAQTLVSNMKAESKGVKVSDSPMDPARREVAATTASSDARLTSVPSLIIFACEAGMGSSAMGASILKKKLKNAGMSLDVQHLPVNQLPQNAEVVFTQASLADRARSVVPSATIYIVDNFLDKVTYDQFVNDLLKIKS